MIDISIIIVNYNVKDYLEQLLYSIFNASKNLKIEIFVVDNYSHDGSVEFIESTFKNKIHLIKNQKNLGFGKANNQAIQKAKGKYLLLINPDTLIQENTLEKMAEYMDSNPVAGAIGCKILNPDGSLQLACRRNFPSPLSALFKIIGLSSLFPKSRFFSDYNLSYYDENQIHEVEALSGSFMFIRKSALDEIGAFDESYFMYGEDLDLCFRIQKKYKIFYVPNTQVIHFKGESSKFNFWKTKIEFYRSMAIFVKKNYHSSWLFWLKPIIYISIFFNAIFNLLKLILKKNIVFLLDLISINAAFLISVVVRFNQFILLPPFEGIISYILIMSYNSAIYGIIYYFMNIHLEKNKFFIPKIMEYSIIGGISSILLTYFIKPLAFSRVVVLLSAIITLFFLVLWRFIYSRFSDVQIGYLSKRKTVFIGHGEKLQYFLDKLQNTALIEFDLIGIISPKGEDIGKTINNLQIIGEINYLNLLIEKYNIEEIITSSDFFTSEDLLNLITAPKKNGVSIKLISEKLDTFIGENQVEQFNDISLLEIDDNQTKFKLHKLSIRIFDLIGSLILILISNPIFLFSLILYKINLDKDTLLQYNKVDSQFYYSGRKKKFFQKMVMFYLNLFYVFFGKISFVGIKPTEIQSQGFRKLKPGLLSILSVLNFNKLTEDQKRSYYFYYLKNYSMIFNLEIIMRKIFTKN